MRYANTKVASKKQEKRIANELNAKVTIASGALDFQKADVRNDLFLVEAKTTEKSFYPLSANTWLKIEREALSDGIRVPLMCIDLNNGSDSIAVLSDNDFECMFKSNSEVNERFVFKQLNTLTGRTSKRLKPMVDNNVEIDSFKTTIPYHPFIYEGIASLVVLDWKDFLLLNEVI